MSVFTQTEKSFSQAIYVSSFEMAYFMLLRLVTICGSIHQYIQTKIAIICIISSYTDLDALQENLQYMIILQLAH